MQPQVAPSVELDFVSIENFTVQFVALMNVAMIALYMLYDQHALIWDLGNCEKSFFFDLTALLMWALVIKFQAFLRTQDDRVVW
jgi:hypothetical protein